MYQWAWLRLWRIKPSNSKSIPVMKYNISTNSLYWTGNRSHCNGNRLSYFQLLRLLCYPLIGKPVILGRGTQELGTDLMLSVTLYSITGANINWFLGERKLYNGSNYKINTSTTPVTLVQYNKEIQVEGFITTLEIYNYNSLLSNAYTCRITNDIGSVDEVLLSQPSK